MSSLLDAAERITSLVTGRQSQHLEVPSADSAALLSVTAHHISEKMGEPVVLTVLVSHPRAISRRDYLNQEASFSLTADDGTTRKWSGFISSFSRIKTTNDFVSYEIVVKSHLARLQGIRDTKIYQHKTIPQILEAILVRHKFKPHQYLFRLRGVYPFASTVNDASLPELARFLRPQGGLIDTFLATQLAGVIQLQGDQWVPVPAATGTSSAARAVDPAFLKAINTLQRIAAHLLAQGEPSYRFELKPVPTPGITDTLLTIDAQKLHYYNQMETWSGMAWPTSDPQSAGTRLEWQTETAGTNKRFEFAGRWAFVRMLERAHVEPIDTATYQVTWQAKAQFEDTRTKFAKTNEAIDQDALNAHGPSAPAPADMAYPLTYMLRTDVGKGPLELLDLRGFTLPTRIFVKRETAGRNTKTDGPPPLPKAAIEAAKQAETPLPNGRGTL